MNTSCVSKPLALPTVRGGPHENGLQIYLDGEAGRIVIDLDQAAARQLAHTVGIATGD